MTLTENIFRGLFGGLISLAALSTLAIASGGHASEGAQIAVIDESNSGASVIELTIANIKKTKGTLRIALYDSEVDFETGAPARSAQIAVTGNQAAVSFTGIAAGEYVVAVHHDANDDDEMNTNPFGIPTEQYGFSNDVMGRFGPPSWDRAKFTVGESAVQTLTLN